MENGILQKDFGLVPCGQNNTDILKIENTSKKAHTLVVKFQKERLELSNERLRIHPTRAVAQPGQSARFTLTYLSFLEDIVDNYYCYVLENEKLIARFSVRAQSVGPCLTPTVYKLKFFQFRNVSQMVKRIEITNTVKCEAKFFFDLDEDYQHLEISQTQGTIPPGLKLGLTFTFKPIEPVVYYKRIFCIVQFHKPIIFNILGVYKPKLKLDPKKIKFRFPPEEHYPNNYAEYMAKGIPVTVPERERSAFYLKCAEEYENFLREAEEVESEKKRWSVLLDSVSESDGQLSDGVLAQVCLTTSFIDINNSPEILKATTLINLSKCQLYYFEWDHDPKNHFRMDPCNGFIEPSTRIHFSIYFTPSILDLLYHIELDIRVFPCSNETNENSMQIIDLPVTMSLRIIGHSFPDDSCGWIPQCRINLKTLHLRSCVPGEVVYGTFMLERERHLPATFSVVPPKDPNFSVQPTLGYLSKSFQLFIVQFNSESKIAGVYTEDLKIKFNNSNKNCETIKLVTSVEIPALIFGKNNSLNFTPIFPGSKSAAVIPIENPTNLCINYEFVMPEDITWAEVVNPKGSIEPKSFGEVEVVFKPEVPCEYLDYVPCYVSSITKPDCTVTIHLQLIGSCQFGYLVATPSIYDFGESLYLTEKSIDIHLFNFSSSLLHFRLKTVHRAFPVGNPEEDVIITPDRGSVPAKSSIKVTMTIIPHNIDIMQYAVLCQNYESDLEEASPQGEPTKIFLFRFEGVTAGLQILDMYVIGGGPLFSAHWLWKMFNLEKLNKALKSLSCQEDVVVRFSDTIIRAEPISIAMLLEANKYGTVVWRLKHQLVCPCLEASDVSLSKIPVCKHVKDEEPDYSYRLNAKERVVIAVHLKNNPVTDCIYEWTIDVPHHKKIFLKMLVDTSPSGVNDFILNSMYLGPTFSLKPVFIGDAHPPLQLFWLYNNTSEPVSYSVENITLKEGTPDSEGIFDCTNPRGIIPPISSLPLKFVFKPTELKSYSADVKLCMNNSEINSIHLTGEGIASTQPFQEFFIPKTLPKKPVLLNLEADISCSENFIDITYFRMFSHAKRVFFLRNNSKSAAWSFRWHSFNVPDIVSAEIMPSEGVIQPETSATMTLMLKSFSYPTFISFSIPCDVINYSDLVDYESSVRYREVMTEKAKDCFIITEHGTTYEEPVFPEKIKPEPAHIFITVNTNIVSSLSIDQKIPHQQQLVLKAENEMSITSTANAETQLHPSTLSSIQRVLENLLWKVLVCNNVKENIKKLELSQDYNYLQILPESKKRCEENSRRFFALPTKIEVQRLLQSTLTEILAENFSSEKN